MTEGPVDGGAPVNLGGLGGVDMYPGQTADALRMLASAGLIFDGVWQTHQGLIEFEERQLGNGPLSAGFRDQYNANAPALMRSGDEVRNIYGGLAGLGARTVQRYLEVDGQVVPATLANLGQ